MNIFLKSETGKGLLTIIFGRVQCLISVISAILEDPNYPFLDPFPFSFPWFRAEFFTKLKVCVVLNERITLPRRDNAL